MAFRLRRKRHVARQASRVVARELASAIEAIGPDGDVHEARKHLKKARAVVRLLERGLGRDYRTLIAGLRTASRRLSASRDAEACIESFEKLRARYPRVLTASAGRSIDRALTLDKLRAQSAAPRILRRVARVLEQSARTIPRRVLKAAGGQAMREGMDRAYRRARKAMAVAREDPDDAGLHRWRRRVKDHWYQMRLLEGVNPHVGGRVRALRQLETWLGDHHDLVVLHHLVLSAPARFGGEQVVAGQLGCIDTRKEMLARRAWKNGARLFAPRPARFSRQIDRWWKG